MQALPGTLRAATKQRPNSTPHNRMQMMRIDEVRVPNTNKGLHKRARPGRSMASNTQKAISPRHPSIQVVFRGEWGGTRCVPAGPYCVCRVSSTCRVAAQILDSDLGTVHDAFMSPIRIHSIKGAQFILQDVYLSQSIPSDAAAGPGSSLKDKRWGRPLPRLAGLTDRSRISF
jgi:hypothetical protein